MELCLLSVLITESWRSTETRSFALRVSVFRLSVVYLSQEGICLPSRNFHINHQATKSGIPSLVVAEERDEL